MKEALITRINKEYEKALDVVVSLEDEQIIDLEKERPKLQQSKKKDDAKELEDKEFGYKFREENRRWEERKDVLKYGLVKAYGLITDEYMTKAMKDRIEEHPDYETKIKRDPIALLIAIKSCMHESQRAQYPYASMTDTLQRMLNIKQRDDEPLMDYIKRFKQMRDVFIANFGTAMYDAWVENQEMYRDATDAAAKKALKDNAMEEWTAYMVVRTCDSNKYGSVMQTFKSQYSYGTDQYPRTIMAATDALSKHPFDSKYRELQKQRAHQHREREAAGPHRS